MSAKEMVSVKTFKKWPFSKYFDYKLDDDNCIEEIIFLTHPCRRQPLKICFISNDRGSSLFEAFDWLFICVDPSDVCDLRVNVVVEIEMP